MVENDKSQLKQVLIDLQTKGKFKVDKSIYTETLKAYAHSMIDKYAGPDCESKL